jgi:hypothetical protein
MFFFIFTYFFLFLLGKHLRSAQNSKPRRVRRGVPSGGRRRRRGARRVLRRSATAPGLARRQRPRPEDRPGSGHGARTLRGGAGRSGRPRRPRLLLLHAADHRARGGRRPHVGSAAGRLSSEAVTGAVLGAGFTLLALIVAVFWICRRCCSCCCCDGEGEGKEFKLDEER